VVVAESGGKTTRGELQQSPPQSSVVEAIAPIVEETTMDSADAVKAKDPASPSAALPNTPHHPPTPPSTTLPWSPTTAV